MALKRRNGDIFDSKCQTLVCPVNCVGVMGAGLAKAFKKRYPEILHPYIAECNSGRLVPGELSVYPLGDGKQQVLFFPTKRHWQYRSRIDWVEKGLAKLLESHEELDITSLSLVPLGCGLGGLDEKEVIPLIEGMAEKAPFDVELCVGDGIPF